MRLCTERRKHQKKWARSYGRDFSSLFVGLHTFVCRSLHRAKEGLANRALGAGTAVSLCAASQGGKHGALRPQKPLRPIRDGEVRGSGILFPFLSSPEWLCITVGSCVSRFNVSLLVLAKSQDRVHKPPFLTGKESRSGSNRGCSPYQPSALPLGHTGLP